MARRSERRGRGLAFRALTVLGVLMALVEGIYILLLLAEANPATPVFRFFHAVAQPLALLFPDLFTIANHNLAIIVSYGVPAVFWLVVTGLAARIVS